MSSVQGSDGTVFWKSIPSGPQSGPDLENTVVWKNGPSWVGIKTHMGYNQEAYEAECTALARVLESASRG